MSSLDTPQLRPIHPFPARMAPSIAMRELSRSGTDGLKVLDPMVGSGTTVVLGRMLGHRAYGVDIDPLSVLNAKSWASTSPKNALLKSGDEVLMQARRRYRRLRRRDAYPREADKETKSFVRYWFDENARLQLRALSDCCQRAPQRVQGLLWTALSRTVITKSHGVSLAMDLSHSRPHKVYEKAPVRPFDAFASAMEHIARSSPFIGNPAPKKGTPRANVRAGDARNLPFRARSFDLVITSPPYLNAIDYMRCSKFALVWMGYSVGELRRIRTDSVGTEVGLTSGQQQDLIESVRRIAARQELPRRWARILDRYILDMGRVIAEVSRVLKTNGTAVFVVGDSRVRNVFVSNSKIVELLAADSNLELKQRETRQLPSAHRYLPPPSSTESGERLQGRMRTEVILRFRQAGN